MSSMSTRPAISPSWGISWAAPWRVGCNRSSRGHFRRSCRDLARILPRTARPLNAMATKPTRHQQQAADHLAEALYLITEAFRLDGKGMLEPGDLDEIARRITPISSTFPLDQIVVRALDRRAKTMGLPSTAADLI